MGAPADFGRDELPTGTVTLLFTDVEGSTRLLHAVGDDVFADVIDQHHTVIRQATAANGGTVVSTEGDAFFVVFADAESALRGALEAQRRLLTSEWPGGHAVRVRMGLHTGPVRLGGDNYVGMTVHQAARVSAAANGGQIVVSAQTYAAAASLPPDAQWIDLGRHRLKDLTSPTALYQLAHPELPNITAPLRTLERVRHNLPVVPSSFLGREAELAEARRLLATTQLLTVLGPGGTGKTRLALQLAGDQLAEFPAGAWVAQLAPVSDGDTIARVLMAAMGLTDDDTRSELDIVIAFLERSRALLVVDNCEHLISSTSEIVGAVMAACPDVVVVATSREPLRLPGETVWTLPPLDVAHAVRLFAERATEAKPNLVLTEADAERVAAICRRLEGMPLAIELAAARVRSLRIADIETRMAESFDLVAAGRGRDDRQSSLEAAIGWSYDLLPPDEQAAFECLAVFAGDFDLAAAEFVGADVEQLSALVDKSLVVFEDDERYRLLETIRAFAAARLRDRDGAEGAADRHADYYRAFAAAYTRDELVWNRFDTERANLEAALTRLDTSGRHAERAEMVLHLSEYWDRRGLWHLNRRELTVSLDALADDPVRKAIALQSLASAESRLANYDEAIKYCEAAVDAWHAIGDRGREGHALGTLGTIAMTAGDLPTARPHLEAARAIAVDVDNKLLVGKWSGNLGVLASRVGDFDAARACYEEALAMAVAAGDRASEGFWIGTLGMNDLHRGDLEEARGRFVDALGIAREVGERDVEGHWLDSLGRLAAHEGNRAEALVLLAEARDIFREVGDTGHANSCAEALEIVERG